MRVCVCAPGVGCACVWVCDTLSVTRVIRNQAVPASSSCLADPLCRPVKAAADWGERYLSAQDTWYPLSPASRESEAAEAGDVFAGVTHTWNMGRKSSWTPC